MSEGSGLRAATVLGRRSPRPSEVAEFGELGPEVRGVLFDLDDTLFDHALSCREAIRLLRTESEYLQRRPLDDLWHDYLGLLTSSGVRDPADPRGINDRRPERWRALARTCGVELDGSASEDLSTRYRGLYQRLRRPIDGATDVVHELHRRLPVAIVTNNESAEQEEKLRFLGLADVVDALVVSEAVGVAKPEPAIFGEALRRLGLRPHEAVMVGDSWTSDVLGARRAGLRAVWFNRFALAPPPGETAEELRSFRPTSRAIDQLLRSALRPTASPPPSRPGR